MPSLFAHAAAGAAVALAVRPTRRVALAGAALACLPDADVIGYALGVPYESVLGHRGLSHALLDAMTTGGLGPALWLPLSDARVFFPFRPVLVSPLGLRAFVSARGLAVLASEALWVGVPSALLAAWALRPGRRRAGGAQRP